MVFKIKKNYNNDKLIMIFKKEKKNDKLIDW